MAYGNWNDTTYFGIHRYIWFGSLPVSLSRHLWFSIWLQGIVKLGVVSHFKHKLGLVKSPVPQSSSSERQIDIQWVNGFPVVTVLDEFEWALHLQASSLRVFTEVVAALVPNETRCSEPVSLIWNVYLHGFIRTLQFWRRDYASARSMA